MKIKKIPILILFLFSIVISTYGQTENTETGILVGKPKIKKFFENNYPLSDLSLDINYSVPNFYSDFFLNNVNNGFVENVFGGGISLKADFFEVFILDFNFYETEYKSALSTNKIHLTDFGIDFSYRLLRNKFIKPYVGVGYKFSNLTTDNSSINTSQEIWKAGLIIETFNIDEFYIYLIGEYKQPFKITKPYSYNQITIGIGVTVNNY